MKKREVVEGGLRNAPFGEQTKAAVEWRFHDALFFKNIRERPVAHHFGEAVALADGVGHPRSHKGCVRHSGLVHIARVELAPDEGRIRESGCGDLFVNFFDCAADHLISWNLFVRAEDILGLVIAVDVS